MMIDFYLSEIRFHLAILLFSSSHASIAVSLTDVFYSIEFIKHLVVGYDYQIKILHDLDHSELFDSETTKHPFYIKT